MPILARLLIAVVVLALVAPAPAQAVPAPGAPATLAGRLLIAAPALSDGGFARSIIYVFRHGPNGAAGLVVNRPLGPLPLSRLLRRFGFEGGDAAEVEMHHGGPVKPGRTFILHTRPEPGLAVGEPADILAAVAAGKGPRRMLVAMGYAGWGPGQLESEMRRGAWILGEALEEFVFDGEGDATWRRAYRRFGGVPL